MSRLKRQLQQLRTLVDLQLRLQASKQQSAQSDSRPLAAEGQPATISHGATEQAPSAPGLPATGDASPAVANMLLAGQRIAAEAMVQTPVDRIALGDNLFAAGEVALALEIYRQAEAGDLSEDERLWIRYQTASCQRRLNLRQDAERSYRSLVGLPNAGWYALQSRWWLDALEARQGLEQELARIRQTVQTLEQSLHAPQTP